jgi:hypothetical protein
MTALMPNAAPTRSATLMPALSKTGMDQRLKSICLAKI